MIDSRAGVGSVPVGMLVSIVTPSFNQAEYLEGTLRSVLTQDYPHIEYFVLDGGSSDSSVSIIKKYEDSLAWWASEKDAGQADAVNRGLLRSRGEVVAFLNSDDLYEPGAVAAAVECFQADEDIDIVFGDALVVDAAGLVIGKSVSGPFDYLRLLRTCRNTIPQPSTFLRRRVLDKVGYFNPNLHFVFDLEYWLRAGRRCRFEYLPVVLSRVRHHSASKSSRIKQIAAGEMVQVYDRLFQDCDSDGALRGVRNESMASVCCMAGAYCFAAGLPVETRAFLRRAVQWSPKRLANPSLLFRYLISLLGPRPMRLIYALLGFLSKKPI